MAHLTERLEYEKLLEEYRELQLRVTKFSKTEQDLINTRDRLDHELVLYKRLNKFSADILKDLSDSVFYQLIAEGAIDIFEVEQSIVYIHNHENHKSSYLVIEGKVFSAEDKLELIADIRGLGKHIALGRSVILGAELFQESKILSEYSKGLYFHSYDQERKQSCYILALISKQKAPLYTKLQDRHQTIFTAFVQQIQSVQANRNKSKKIQEQIEHITQSEVELRKLSLIATNTKNGVIISDNQGCVEWVNEAFTNTTGYSLEEIKGRKPKDFLQGKDPELNIKERELLGQALRKKEKVEVTLLNYNKNGKPYYNSLEIAPVFNEKGEHINFIALQRDITSEILHQQEMLHVNSKFELITSKSGIGIWESEMGTGKIQWNEILLEQYGLNTNDSTIDFRIFWRESIHPFDSERVNHQLDHWIANAGDMLELEYRIIRKNDKKVRFLKCVTIAEKDQNGKVLRLIGSSLDITSTREAEIERTHFIEQINSMRMFYENILNNSPAKIAVFDHNLELTYANERLLELEPIWKKVVNRRLSDLKDESEQQAELRTIIKKINESIECRQLTQFEEEIEDENGNVKYILRNLLPYFKPSGQLEYIIMSGVNITELKQFENSIILKNDELKKINSELDNFVYSVSHDLRSPLLAIKGILSLVFKSDKLDSQLIQYLNLANSSVLRLDETIQEILEYSRNSRLDIQLSTFNIKKLVEEIFADLMFSTDGNVRLEYGVLVSEQIVSDKHRINTLLKNLIGNAFKYRRQDIPETIISFSLEEKEGTLIFTIQDNGEGIAENKVGRIFDMFYRGSSNSAGTGLGLYICKEIVLKLNGNIEVQSELHQGTKMTFTIPNFSLHA